MGGRAVPFDELFLALKEADVVVSTTAAEEPIVTYEQYVRVQHARRNRLALILDIAIPRDFDPKIGDLDEVYLYNVDDLRAQAEQNREPASKGSTRPRRSSSARPPPASRPCAIGATPAPCFANSATTPTAIRRREFRSPLHRAPASTRPTARRSLI